MEEAHLKQAVSFVIGELRRTAGYAARREVERVLQGITDKTRLEPFGRKVYSQNDEDGIIEEIFNRLGFIPGTFCEIGVGNGLECNTLYLLHKGWQGSWFDADERSEAFISQKFGSLMGRRLQHTVVKVAINNINSLLMGKDNLDFLSIDVDGMDIHLLDAITIKPKVICIEYNAKFPPPLVKSPVYDPNYTWRGSDYMGASLSAIDGIARKKGYSLVGTNITGANAFFVRNDLLSTSFCAAGPEVLYNPPRYWLTLDAFSMVGHPADFGPYEDLQVKREKQVA